MPARQTAQIMSIPPQADRRLDIICPGELQRPLASKACKTTQWPARRERQPIQRGRGDPSPDAAGHLPIAVPPQTTQASAYPMKPSRLPASAALTYGITKLIDPLSVVLVSERMLVRGR